MLPSLGDAWAARAHSSFTPSTHGTNQVRNSGLLAEGVSVAHTKICCTMQGHTNSLLLLLLQHPAEDYSCFQVKVKFTYYIFPSIFYYSGAYQRPAAAAATSAPRAPPSGPPPAAAEDYTGLRRSSRFGGTSLHLFVLHTAVRL